MLSNNKSWRHHPILGLSLIMVAAMLYGGGVIFHMPSVCLVSWPLLGLGFLLAW